MRTNLNTDGNLQTRGKIEISPFTPGAGFYEDTANTIRTRFKVQIEDVLSVPTQYDNDGAFDKPTDNSAWIRFSVMFGDSLQVSLGSQREFRTPGIAHAAIHSPLGLGDKAALEIADAINAAFRSITISGIVFTTPRAPQHQRDGAEWILIVQCPFHVDDMQT